MLDTHVWIWWLDDPDKIPARARTTLKESARNSTIYVSSISCWEILLLSAKGRLEFTMDADDWITKAEGLPFLHFVPVDNAIARRSVRLPRPFHKDPADRIIVATAMMFGATVISADSRIRKYPHVRTLWK